jgi:hypothetical protein
MGCSASECFILGLGLEFRGWEPGERIEVSGSAECTNCKIIYRDVLGLELRLGLCMYIYIPKEDRCVVRCRMLPLN